MGMFGGIREGSWSIRSESDSRWNKSGRAVWACSGGIHPDADSWVKQCEKKYGKQPDDLTYSFWKD